MTSDYYIRTGDAPEISDELDGNLTESGASVTFSMKPVVARGEVTVDSANVDVPDGAYDGEKDITEVSYTLSASDTSEEGDYLAEFEANYADGRTRSYPKGRYYFISVEEDL